jgi:hypothetical protein
MISLSIQQRNLLIFVIRNCLLPLASRPLFFLIMALVSNFSKLTIGDKYSRKVLDELNVNNLGIGR